MFLLAEAKRSIKPGLLLRRTGHQQSHIWLLRWLESVGLTILNFCLGCMGWSIRRDMMEPVHGNLYLIGSVTQLATSGEISRQELCVHTSWSYWPHRQQHSATSDVSTTDMQVCWSALSWPSRDVIKACTRHSAEVTVRYFLIMSLFLMWKWPALNI